VTLRVETGDGEYRLTCDWLLACDGARSTVRHILGLLSLAKKYGGATVDDACAAALELGVSEYQFVRRYHVDQAQAQRVGHLAQQLLRGLKAPDDGMESVSMFLDWAVRLHEIGISIGQGAYHKHSAYILANADMPGFSRQEQGYLSNLVLAQRGKLSKMRAAFDDDLRLAALALCLRLAVIFYRSRRSLKLPKLSLARTGDGFTLAIERRWLEDSGLVSLALDAEREQWGSVGVAFDVVQTYGYVLLLAAAQLPGYFSAAWLVERWGRKRTFVTGLAGFVPIGTATPAFAPAAAGPWKCAAVAGPVRPM